MFKNLSTNFPTTQILLIAFLVLNIVRICPGAYLKSRCGFQSQNYTIKWAYEPQTRNVVFVLKAKLPPKAAMANLLDEVEGGGTKQQVFFENE
jgi:hypothetical protein